MKIVFKMYLCPCINVLKDRIRASSRLIDNIVLLYNVVVIYRYSTSIEKYASSQSDIVN